MAKKGYTDKTTLENYTLQTIDATFSTQIDAWIEAVEVFIDRMTGRNFIADSEASNRVYDGNGKSELLVDDYVALTEIKVGGVAVAALDSLNNPNYYQYPVNTTRKYKIKLVGQYFTEGDQNITVKAKWGYSAAVPADVKLAATIILAGIIGYANKGLNKRSETIGSYSVSYDTERGWQDYESALKILQNYRKLTF